MKIKLFRKMNIVILVCVVFFVSVLNLMAASTIRLTHDQPPDTDNPTHAYALAVKAIMEAETEYEVEIYPSSELGGERERLDQTADEMIHINLASVGGMGMIFKPMYIYNTPFMYRSDRVYREFFWNSEWNEYMFEKFRGATTNLEPIHAFQRGTLSAFTNSKLPITSLEDFKTLKLRGMDEQQVALFKALGANATIVPFAELYTALQTGVVDGQLNPISMIRDMRFQEVQDYLSLAKCIPGSGFVVVSQGWYNNLSDEVRSILDEAFHSASVIAAGLSEKRYGETLEYFNENNSFKEINSLIMSPDYPQIRELGQQVGIEWAKTIMEEEIVDRYVQSVKEIEKSIYGD